MIVCFFLILMMGRINIIKLNLVSKSTIRKCSYVHVLSPKNNEKHEKIENKGNKKMSCISAFPAHLCHFHTFYQIYATCNRYFLTL